MPAMRRFVLALAFPAAYSLGCTDYSRFSTGKDEAYCGSVTLGGSFRTGMSPKVLMRLRLDAEQLDGPASPGTISTFEDERRLFDETELRLIEPLGHDALSRLEFGDSRERNAMFAL